MHTVCLFHVCTGRGAPAAYSEERTVWAGADVPQQDHQEVRLHVWRQKVSHLQICMYAYMYTYMVYHAMYNHVLYFQLICFVDSYCTKWPGFVHNTCEYIEMPTDGWWVYTWAGHMWKHLHWQSWATAKLGSLYMESDPLIDVLISLSFACWYSSRNPMQSFPMAVYL